MERTVGCAFPHAARRSRPRRLTSTHAIPAVTLAVTAARQDLTRQQAAAHAGWARELLAGNTRPSRRARARGEPQSGAVGSGYSALADARASGQPWARGNCALRARKATVTNADATNTAAVAAAGRVFAISLLTRLASPAVFAYTFSSVRHACAVMRATAWAYPCVAFDTRPSGGADALCGRAVAVAVLPAALALVARA